MTTQRALDQFLRTEEAVDLRDWRCTNPLCAAAAGHPLKCTNVVEWPEALLLNLVRWRGESMLAHPVHPAAELVAASVRYELVSVVCHLGERADAGHYIAYAKHNARWHLYDDSPSKCQALPCLATNRDHKTYLAFYRRLPA